MTIPEKSCLVQKLSHYVDLTELSRKQLMSLEETEREFGKHAEVYRSGDRNDRLYVVKRGWLYSYTDLPDGRRQIVKIHHPGDIIGFPDIAFDTATTTLQTSEQACLCPFSKSALELIFQRSPQLTALMFSLAVRDQAIMIDALRAMGRMSAREKLAHLLLDLISRLRISNKNLTDTLRLPLNQFEIGDAVGLTNVYVSKTLIVLEREGFIRRRGDEIQLLKEQALAQLVDFSDRHHAMDTSWFPNAS